MFADKQTKVKCHKVHRQPDKNQIIFFVLEMKRKTYKLNLSTENFKTLKIFHFVKKTFDFKSTPSTIFCLTLTFLHLQRNYSYFNFNHCAKSSFNHCAKRSSLVLEFKVEIPSDFHRPSSMKIFPS